MPHRVVILCKWYKQGTKNSISLWYKSLLLLSTIYLERALALKISDGWINTIRIILCKKKSNRVGPKVHNSIVVEKGKEIPKRTC